LVCFFCIILIFSVLSRNIQPYLKPMVSKHIYPIAGLSHDQACVF